MTDYFGNDDEVGFSVTSLRQAMFFLREFDFEAQLKAAKAVLQRNRQADEAFSASLVDLRERASKAEGEYANFLDDQLSDHIFHSFFMDAAYSMSAVGMLAPLSESLFCSIFRGLRTYQQAEEERTLRDQRTAISLDEFWDPHFVFAKGGRRTDLVAGIRQLSDSIGLEKHLADDYHRTLAALFAYRNKMFHHGFEWPKDERRKFQETIRREGWPSEWFVGSTANGDPWIFYMSTDFIDHCLATIDGVLDGVGNYLKEKQVGKP